MVANVELKKQLEEQDARLTALAEANAKLTEQLTESLELLKLQNDKVAKLEDAAVAAVVPDVKKNKKPIRADRPETGGWVVRAKNEGYFGECYSTKFQGGLAIIYLEEDDADFRVSRLEADFEMEVTPAENEGILDALKYQAGVKPPDKTIHEKLLGGQK